MSDFILEYDVKEAIAKNARLLGKSSEEYADCLDIKIARAISDITGPSSGIYVVQTENQITTSNSGTRVGKNSTSIE